MEKDYNSMGREPINRNVTFNTYRSYTFINNSLFYPLVPSHLFDYYNRFVRSYFYWYDGYDPIFHTPDSGIMSTRIAYTLCSNLAQKVVGTDVLFDALKESKKTLTNVKQFEGMTALETTEHWAEHVGLVSKLKTLTSFGFAGGDSLIKLDGAKKIPYPNMLRKDNYFLTTDLSGKIVGFTGLLYTWTNNKARDGSGDEEREYYYILEKREFDKKGDPIYKIYVKMGKGNVTTIKEIDVRDVQPIEWSRLPRKLKDSIREMYPNATLGQWNKLPFNDSLGLYLFKNTDNVSFIPQMNMGESLLSNIMTYLMLYDFYFSSMATDLHNGRGKVIMPKPMQSPDSEFGGSHYSEMSDGYYAMFDYLDPNKQKPIPIQFDVRANDWATTSKNILRGIAMSLDVSERTITQSLSEGVEKATAREVSVDDKTSNFVTEKRTYLRKPLNDMLRDVLEFFGFNCEEDLIKVRFSRVGLTNMNDATQQMTVLRQNKLVTRVVALETLFPDMNKKQILDMAKELKEEEQEQKMYKEMKEQEVDKKGTSDEDYEQTNNNDISHIKKNDE